MPIKPGHKAFWAIKAFNSNFKNPGHERKLQLNELEELRNDSYENSKIIKAKLKPFMIVVFHEKHLKLVKKFCFIIVVFIYFLEN